MEQNAGYNDHTFVGYSIHTLNHIHCEGVCEGVKSGQVLVCPGGLALITNRGPQTQTNYMYHTICTPPPPASPCPGVSSRFYFGLSWEAPYTCRSIAQAGQGDLTTSTCKS